MKKNLFVLAAGLMVSVATLAQNGNHSGKHLHLDGATQYLEISDTANLNYSVERGAMTITFWVNDSSASGANNRLISNRTGSGNGYDWFMNASRVGPNIDDGPNIGGAYSTAITSYYNNWHHIAFVIDPVSATYTAYADGVQIDTKPNAAFGDIANSFAGSASAIRFGVYDNNGTFANYFKGDVDDIRFYSGAFTQSQVQADMTASVNASTPNLLAAYDFEDATSTTAPNIASTGSGYDATLVGNPVLNTDPAPLQPVTPAHSLTLDGTSSYMSVPTSSTVNVPASNSFTLTCWVNLSNSSTGKRIISKRLGAGNYGYELITSGSMQYGANISDATGGVGPVFSTATIGGSWHHLAMVIDRTANTSSIYIDGVLAQTNSNTRISTGDFTNTQDLLIGAWNNGTSVAPSAIGEIDDIRLWSTAFTQSQVQNDMTATVTGPTTDLLAAWDFENITGNSVPDISGNGNTGTLVGGAALPISISNFSGHYSATSNSIALQWKTANAVNIKNVVLEYSTDGRNYQPLYTTTPTGSETEAYRYTHQLNNITAASIYYRLKIVGNDGNVSYNNIIHFNITQTNVLLRIAPNPASDNISVETNLSGIVNVTVYDIAGRKVLHQTENSNSFTLNISALPQGVYILKAGNGVAQQSAKLIKK